MGGSAAKGGSRAAQKGLEGIGARGETITGSSSSSYPGSATILDSTVFRPIFSTGRSIPPANEAADSLYYSPDTATTFPRRTDRGRRGFQARGDGHGRRVFCGWCPTNCETAHFYGLPRSATGSEGRRVRQGRRTERRVRPSDPTVPKGVLPCALRLPPSVAARSPHFPPFGARSSHADGSGSALPRFRSPRLLSNRWPCSSGHRRNGLACRW